MKEVVNILVLSDLHYSSSKDAGSSIPSRRSELGVVLMEKALHRLQHLDVPVDLVVLLGDMIDDGNGENAKRDLEQIAATVAGWGIPFLAVSGNHDGDSVRFAECFGCEPGLHKIGGYGFIVFNDDVGEGDVTKRSENNLLLPEQIAAENPDLPLVVLQHNPLHPSIQSEYPYMLTNNGSVLESYINAGVVLSLSGHYHAGQPAHQVSDLTGTEACPTVNQRSDAELTVYTVPALCEEPFRFAHVQLDGREVTVTEHALRMDIPGLMDTHCHTEYAFCGDTVNSELNIAISKAMGLQRQYFTEHAFHLYFDKDQAWSWEWQTDDALVEQTWNAETPRMSAFKHLAKNVRSDFVSVGLEVDLRADGSLLLAESDYDGWDLLVGAVHSIPNCDIKSLSTAEVENCFLKQTEMLLTNPIQILAHPFRFFRRCELAPPVHLYKIVADMLAENGVAAEINFHTNIPDPRFVEMCLERGVKISFGTDSHDLWEVGELMPHCNVLFKLGVPLAKFDEVLYKG